MTYPNSTDAPAQVAIIGAGPGGLGAAMLLAASGVSVKVYESQPVIGGRTARLTLRGPAGEYHFDRGPTFFLMPYVLDEIFAASGRRLADYVELTRLDPMYRLVIGDAKGGAPTTIDCTQDIAEMSRRLARLDERDGARFPDFIAANRTKLAVFEPVLRKPFRTAIDLLSGEMIRALPLLKPTLSVHGYLSKYFRDPRVRLAMSFQTKYLGMSPYKCPSLFSILPLIEYEYGVWHAKGGLNQLMHAMATACAEMGVEIATDQPVETIAFEGKRAAGVQVRGRRHAHEHVLINADASWAITNLIPADLRRGLGAWSDKRLASMDYSCSTYMLYLGLDRRVDLPHHTIAISSKYEDNIRDITDNGRLSEDPSLYICNPSAMDPSLAPAGHSALYVLVPTPNLKGSIDWSRQAAGLREQALDRVSRLAGFDVRSHIVAEKPSTPEDWKAMNIAYGATFNLAHGLMQMLHRRPQHELAGVENVWLAGGGTHPGSGLPVIFLSSQIAARKLCQRLGVPYAADREPVAASV
jgi:phytoene desaturase